MFSDLPLRSLANNIIGQARSFKKEQRRAARRHQFLNTNDIRDELVEYLTESGYFTSGRAQDFAIAFLDLLITSDPTYRAKKVDNAD